MDIRGFVKLSIIDYPGKFSSIIFVGGCNYRCSYCHNPHLVLDPGSQPLISEQTIYDFLERRMGKLDGIVVSGGEPCLQPDLADFLRPVKEKGFLVKVDTNGSFPGVIRDLVDRNLLDAVGIDYKAPGDKYNEIAGCDRKDLHESVCSTMKVALENGLQTEVRTTVHKALLSEDDLGKIRSELNGLEIEDWILQQFHFSETIGGTLEEQESYSDSELIDIAVELGGRTKVRGIKGTMLLS